MDAARWQSCEDPCKLVVWLRGRASDRKLRLFACAFWRQWWKLLTNEQEDPVPAQESAYLLDYAERWAEQGVQPDSPFPGGGFGWHPLVATNATDAANWTIRETVGFKGRLDSRRDDPKDRERAAEY